MTEGRIQQSEITASQTSLKGREALEALARRFPQLYIAPAEGAQDAHKMAAGQGIAPAEASLAHFEGSPRDELRAVDTPAGPVEVLFLERRRDFETFLQIIGNKCSPVPIARTVGAITYRGIADWGKVSSAHEAYLKAGGDDWKTEFARLAKEPGAFRSELVVISEGPYSNVPAEETPYSEAEWLDVSREIRLHHECAHVVCRRTMPDDVLPVWDEVTADVVGMLSATGRYDVALATRFLGATEDGFTGGRLEEYLNEEQAARIDELAREVHSACERIGNIADSEKASEPFAFLLDLKRSPLLSY